MGIESLLGINPLNAASDINSGMDYNQQLKYLSALLLGQQQPQVFSNPIAAGLMGAAAAMPGGGGVEQINKLAERDAAANAQNLRARLAGIELSGKVNEMQKQQAAAKATLAMVENAVPGFKNLPNYQDIVSNVGAGNLDQAALLNYAKLGEAGVKRQEEESARPLLAKQLAALGYNQEELANLPSSALNTLYDNAIKQKQINETLEFRRQAAADRAEDRQYRKEQQGNTIGAVSGSIEAQIPSWNEIGSSLKNNPFVSREQQKLIDGHLSAINTLSSQPQTIKSLSALETHGKSLERLANDVNNKALAQDKASYGQTESAIRQLAGQGEAVQKEIESLTANKDYIKAKSNLKGTINSALAGVGLKSGDQLTVQATEAAIAAKLQRLNNISEQISRLKELTPTSAARFGVNETQQQQQVSPQVQQPQGLSLGATVVERDASGAPVIPIGKIEQGTSVTFEPVKIAPKTPAPQVGPQSSAAKEIISGQFPPEISGMSAAATSDIAQDAVTREPNPNKVVVSSPEKTRDAYMNTLAQKPRWVIEEQIASGKAPRSLQQDWEISKANADWKYYGFDMDSTKNLATKSLLNGYIGGMTSFKPFDIKTAEEGTPLHKYSNFTKEVFENVGAFAGAVTEFVGLSGLGLSATPAQFKNKAINFASKILPTSQLGMAASGIHAVGGGAEALQEGRSFSEGFGNVLQGIIGVTGVGQAGQMATKFATDRVVKSGGKLVSAVENILGLGKSTPESLKKVGDIVSQVGGAAAGYTTASMMGMTPEQGYVYLLLGTPNPVSRGINDALRVAAANRKSGDPVGERLLSVADAQKATMDANGQKLQGLDYAKGVADFIGKARPDVVQEFVKNPTKMFPGLSRADVDAVMKFTLPHAENAMYMAKYGMDKKFYAERSTELAKSAAEAGIRQDVINKTMPGYEPQTQTAPEQVPFNQSTATLQTSSNPIQAILERIPFSQTRATGVPSNVQIPSQASSQDLSQQQLLNLPPQVRARYFEMLGPLTKTEGYVNPRRPQSTQALDETTMTSAILEQLLREKLTPYVP